MSLLARFKSTISIPCLLGVLLLALSLRVVAYFGVRIEDLQFVYFPLLLLAVFFLPTKKCYRIPATLLLLTSGLWLLASAHVEGYLPSVEDSNAAITIARLEGDTSGMEARSLFLRINQIARTYELPSAEMMRKSLRDRSSAHEWKQGNIRCSTLLSGTSAWLSLDLCESLSKYLGPLLSDFPAPDDVSVKERVKKWKLIANQNVVFLSLARSSQPFALLYQPESLVVPGQPEELARHWITWFAAALPVEEQSLRSEKERENFFAKRLDALNEASLISGPWKSDAPRALSHYLSGTLLLLQSSLSSSLNIDESLLHFRAAAGKVSQGSSAELFRSIFNNAALALIAKADSLEDFKKARSWLYMAIDTEAGLSDSPALRAAFYNLETLDSLQLGVS